MLLVIYQHHLTIVPCYEALIVSVTGNNEITMKLRITCWNHTTEIEIETDWGSDYDEEREKERE